MATTPKAPAANRAEKAAKKTYLVLARLDHDGEVYMPADEVKDADEVELTDDQAKPLIDLKVVKLKPAT